LIPVFWTSLISSIRTRKRGAGSRGRCT